MLFVVLMHALQFIYDISYANVDKRWGKALGLVGTCGILSSTAIVAARLPPLFAKAIKYKTH